MYTTQVLKISGTDVLLAQLRAIGDEFAVRQLRRAARKAFQPVYAAAHRYALKSMDTGQLLDAIQLNVIAPKEGNVVVAAGIRISKKQNRNPNRLRTLKHRNPNRRWHFVEFGTVHMAAKPFLRPAIDANAQLVVDILKEELVKGIARATKRLAKGKKP